MTDIVTSRRGVSVRLTDERWAHIVEEHNELAGLRPSVLDAVELAERILEGRRGELLAIRRREPGKWIVVVYREFNADGFIITAFLTSKGRTLSRRRQLWP